MIQFKETSRDKPSTLQGHRIRRALRISQDDVLAFAALSGDNSPIHVDTRSAKLQGFDGPVVHGLLLGAHISAIIGTDLPGHGWVLKSLQLDFRNPAIYPCLLGIEVYAENYISSVQLLSLRIAITSKDDQLLVKGRAECIYKME